MDLRPSGDRPAYEIRVATLTDGPALLDLYRSLSAQSARMRFSALISGWALERAAALDPEGDVLSVVAVAADGRVLGEARIGSSRDEEHEFAVTIADDAQQFGLGTALLERLRAEARQRGVVSMRAVVRIDNSAMLRLLRRIGGAIVRVAEGDVLFDIASDGAMPAWPSRSRGPRCWWRRTAWRRAPRPRRCGRRAST